MNENSLFIYIKGDIQMQELAHITNSPITTKEGRMIYTVNANQQIEQITKKVDSERHA
jgi:hypothetical protein